MTDQSTTRGSADEAIAVPPEAPGARKGGNLYFGATVIAMAAALLRYVALARFLGPQQLGLAATIVVTGAFFDLVSDTGSDRFLIQDSEGDSPRVQNLVQLVYVGRAFLIAASLVVFSIPIAHFYKAPPLARGLTIFALSPLIMGFIHLDNRRVQRAHDFRPAAIIMIVGEAASVFGTVLAAYLTHAFTAILFGLIARSAIMVVTSHLLATRRYAVGYDRTVAPRLARYSRPLILTGVMLFVGSQSDRVIVGNQLGVTSLGHYSAVLLLVYYPSSLFLSFIHAIYVPLIAGERDDPAGRNRVMDRLGGQAMLLALSMMTGFAVVAPIAVPVLYGARYREPALILTLIGILQMWRFLIVAPTTIALSIGKSRTVLAGNLVRLLVFPGAYIGLKTIGGLTGVVAGFAAAEAVAVFVETVLVSRDTSRPLVTGLDRLVVFVAACVAVLGAEIAWDHRFLAGDAAACVVLVVLLLWVVRHEQEALVDAAALVGEKLRGLKARLAASRSNGRLGR
jgi:O-antigen/teichoic acid export membrane protein